MTFVTLFASKKSLIMNNNAKIYEFFETAKHA